MNYFRKSLQMMATPVRIEFREGEKPFAGKRNMLTPNQQYKRDRILKARANLVNKT